MILHNLTFELRDEMTRAELAKFLSEVPEGATINVDVHHIAKDRPWESARTDVKLRAQWVTE